MQVTEFFKALSDPTRLAVIQLLKDKDAMCVCEMVDILEQPQPTVSRHLNHLKRLGILDSERRGTWMWYSFDANLPAWAVAIINDLPNEVV